MTRIERAFRAKLKQVDKTKEQIAALRDKLRDQISDLEDVIGSCTECVDLIEDGVRMLTDAADEISGYL